jgi:hypothetical protein
MPDAKASALLAALCLASVALSACSKQQPQDEMTWARAALERNDRLEIIGADPATRSFTVRNRDTREMSIVQVDQLIAGPRTGTAPAPEPPAPAGAAATTAPAAPEPLAPAGDAAALAAAVSARGTSIASPGEAAEPLPAPSSPTVYATRAPQLRSQPRRVPGQVLAVGPGYSIQAGSGSDAGLGTEPRSATEAGSGIQASSGTQAGSGPAGATALRKAAASGAVQLRHEPIVCQGQRLMHLDNVDLQFDGDAVSAQDGCEIHITNSRIRAGGVGVTARAANVHIDNSQIEGDAAAIEASDGAQIYAVSSKFQGMSRRLDSATVHDLGGNVWN